MIRRGVQVLLLTEHDDKLDAARYEAIRVECAALSDARFLVIPGLEIRCWRTEEEQWHIAGIGVEKWIERGTVEEVVERIHAACGLAVLLHPHKYARKIDPAATSLFDGIELWNAKEDGNYAPRRDTLELVTEIVKGRRAKSAQGSSGASGGVSNPLLFCGLDLHGLEATGGPELEIESAELTRESVLASLTKGAFWMVARGYRISSTDGPTAEQRRSLRAARWLYELYAALRKVPVVGKGVGTARRAIGKE
jgi:hypothetical protein